jgi:hypothetical protein
MTEVFTDWYDQLESAEKSELLAKIALLRQFGPQLRRPHADTLKGSKYRNMKELRAGTAASVLRVAFAFDPARSAILLVGGNKAGVNERRFYRQLLAQADALFGAFLLQSGIDDEGKAK